MDLVRSESWAVVTGASSGIGKAFADLLAQDGINVVLAAREEQTLKLVAQELENKYGIRAEVYAGDLSDMTISEGLYALIGQKKLRVSCLINSAGFGNYGSLVDTDWEKLQAMINLNITALTYLSQAFGRDMKRRGGGRIVNIASTAAFMPGPNMAVYYATKAYVLHLSEAINEELKGSGVSVTALCPGPTATRFAAAAHADQSAIFKNRTSPTVKQVAAYGYKAMLAGKPVAIHGQTNRRLIFLTRFIPRQMLTKMVRRFQG